MRLRKDLVMMKLSAVGAVHPYSTCPYCGSNHTVLTEGGYDGPYEQRSLRHCNDCTGLFVNVYLDFTLIRVERS